MKNFIKALRHWNRKYASYLKTPDFKRLLPGEPSIRQFINMWHNHSGDFLSMWKSTRKDMLSKRIGKKAIIQEFKKRLNDTK